MPNPQRTWETRRSLYGKSGKKRQPSSADLFDRLWSHCMPIPESGCWVWMGSLRHGGYGQVTFRGRPIGSHRAMWLLLRGAIPEGLELDHKCRVRSCCNPDHLEPVTSQVNTLRGQSPAAMRA